MPVGVRTASFAVVEEVDVAGVVEDAGDVGGEEELALADAKDSGRAHAGGDELIGLVRRRGRRWRRRR